MKIIIVICFTSILISCPSLAQFSQKENDLISAYQRATDDAGKIDALGELAEYYYIYKLEKKADSILQLQLSIAEMSNNKDLIFKTLFSNAILNINSWTSIETFDRTTKFIEKGLNYAKESGRDDYMASAYIRLANILKKRGLYDNAIQQATLAFSSLGNIPSDSLRIILYTELGDIYKEKGDVVHAYKNYNNAFDIAYKLKNTVRESAIYHNYASLYQSLGNNELAKENLKKSLALNSSGNNTEGLLDDYIALARLTDEKQYIEKAYQLADSIHSEKYRLFSKRLMFSYYMVKGGNSTITLDYFYKNGDLLQSYKNSGISYFYWTLGNIYRYSNQPDSAIHYYKFAEAELEKIYSDKNTRLIIYLGLADTYYYYTHDNTTEAIHYYEKAYAVAKELNSLNNLSAITSALGVLYARQSNFKQAYDFAQQETHYKDTLQKLAAQRDVVLLEVDRENKRHEKDMQDLADKTLRKRNLQYMAITIVLATLFLFMLIIGMFPVSKLTIKLLGYFAFISLFEFIIVLIDSFIHRLAHGEPLKIWLIKIGLIALLVPFQHYLEHGLIKFLASRKLIAARNNFSLKKIWLNIKKPSLKAGTDIDEDTAVL